LFQKLDIFLSLEKAAAAMTAAVWLVVKKVIKKIFSYFRCNAVP